MLLRKLAGQTAVYGLSTIVVKLLNFLLTPYLTRIMSTSEFGVVTDMYALIPFALVVLTMGMESGYFRFAGKAEGPDAKRKVFATAWGAVSLAAVLFMSVVLLFRGDLAEVMGYAERPSFIWIVGAIIMLDVVARVPFAHLREEGRATAYVMVNVLAACITLGLCLFFYHVLPLLSQSSSFFASIYDPGFGAGYYMVANLAASAVTLLVLLPTTGGVAPRIDRRLFGRIALYSLPLLVSGIAGTATDFIDRQMIKYLLPAGEAMSSLGIYGAMTKIAVVMVMFTQMYRLAAEPFFLADFPKNDFRRLNAEAMKYFVLVSVLIFLFISLFADVFALLIGRDFRQGTFILPVVLGANVLSGIVLNLSFWYKQTGATRFAIYVTGLGLIVSVLLNLWLVPRMGYYGSAWARLLANLVMVVQSYYLNQKYDPIPYDLRRIGEYILLGGVLYTVSIPAENLPDAARYAIDLLLTACFIAYAVRKEKIDVRRLLRGLLRRR